MDCYRHDEALHLHIDMPGVDAEPLDVTQESNRLTVRALRNAPHPRTPRSWWYLLFTLADGRRLPGPAAHRSADPAAVTEPCWSGPLTYRITSPKAISNRSCYRPSNAWNSETTTTTAAPSPDQPFVEARLTSDLTVHPGRPRWEERGVFHP